MSWIWLDLAFVSPVLLTIFVFVVIGIIAAFAWRAYRHEGRSRERTDATPHS